MWYALIGDEQVGPLPPQGMAALRREGRLEDTTFVWREGMPDWLPLSQVRELLAAMASFTPQEDVDELDDSDVRGEEEGATVMMDGEQGKDWANYLNSLAQSSTPLAAAVAAPLGGPGALSHATGQQRAVQVAANRAEALVGPPAATPGPTAPAGRTSSPGAAAQGAGSPASGAAASAKGAGSAARGAAASAKGALSAEPGPSGHGSAPSGRGSAQASVATGPSAPAERPSEPGARPLMVEPDTGAPTRSRMSEPELAAPADIDFGSMLEAEDSIDGSASLNLAPPVAAAPAPASGKLKVWLILLPLLGATAAAVVLWVQHAQQDAARLPTPAPISDTVDTAPTQPPTQPPTQAPTQAPSMDPSAAAAATLPPSAAAAATQPPSAAAAATQPPSAAAAPTRPPNAPSEPAKPAPKPPIRPSPPAGGPATSPAAADAAATKTLSRNDIMGVVNNNMAALKGCGAQQPELTGTLSVATTIERDGSVSAAQVTTSRFRGSPVGTCVEQKIKLLRFPKFGADPVRFNLPLSL